MTVETDGSLRPKEVITKVCTFFPLGVDEFRC